MPDASVAVHVIVVSPNAKTAGASLEIVTSCISFTSGSMSSTILESTDVASNIISSGDVISGMVVSISEMSCSAVARLPDASDASHVTVELPKIK